MIITAASTIVGHVDLDEQRQLVAEIEEIVGDESWIVPVAGSLEMSVRIFNAGPLGWLARAGHGYYYSSVNPVTGQPWRPIPQHWIDLAMRFGWPDGIPDDEPPIDCAHIVKYPPGAKLGPHQDKTEADKRGRILTISLGDEAEWRVVDDDGRETKTRLVSGDVTLLAGPTRNLTHQIFKVIPSPTIGMFNPSPLGGPGRYALSIRSGAGRGPV